MKNEKKKDVLIGVLFAIVFILLAVLIALSISEKTKKNDPYDDKKSSTSTTTTAETSENKTEAAAIEKELNEYIKNNPTPLEIKYGLTRKIELTYYQSNDFYDYNVKYYYNIKPVFEGMSSDFKLSDIDTVKKSLDKDEISIEEFKDLKSNQKYYLILSSGDNYGQTYIYSTNFLSQEYLENNEADVICSPGYDFTYKNGTNILSNGERYQISNNKVRYYSANSDMSEISIYDVYFENGILKKEKFDSISSEELIGSGEKC